MVHDPPILILDEPTSGLDPNQIVEIRKLIRRLGAAKTVILSTHILSEVQATCDRVLIINEGKLVADGTPEQLQRDFQGNDQLTIEIRSDANPQTSIAPALRTIEQVVEVSLVSAERSTSRYQVHTAPGSDAREAVFRRAVAEGWVILELSRRTTSLEDVFHKLTAA
jgi:ABC-2 type transport system ATP-binding protein